MGEPRPCRGHVGIDLVPSCFLCGRLYIRNLHLGLICLEPLCTFSRRHVPQSVEIHLGITHQRAAQHTLIVSDGFAEAG